MRFVIWLSAPKMTSGHGDIEKLVRKWCSTNQTAWNPILSASTHCSSVSSITRWSSTTGRCISYARLNRMRNPPGKRIVARARHEEESMLQGLIMDMPLMISSAIRHAAEFHGSTEDVARDVDGTIHRY